MRAPRRASRKCDIAPPRSFGCHSVIDTQEPSSVRISVSAPATAYSPGRSVTSRCSETSAIKPSGLAVDAGCHLHQRVGDVVQRFRMPDAEQPATLERGEDAG